MQSISRGVGLSCGVCALAYFAGVTWASVASAGDVVYRNDFAARTGGPVPSGEWHSLAYAEGDLAYNYNASNYTPVHPYQSAMQDSWVKARTQGIPVNESLSFEAHPDGGNACAMILGNNGDYRGMALHPLYNALTNGTLHYTYDMRPPRKATNGSTML